MNKPQHAPLDIKRNEKAWYVQKGFRVQGPFNQGEISRFLLLGRIRVTDRVSQCSDVWEPVTQVPQLIPEELLDLQSINLFDQVPLHNNHIHLPEKPEESVNLEDVKIEPDIYDHIGNISKFASVIPGAIILAFFIISVVLIHLDY